MSTAPSEQQNRETFFSSAAQQLNRLYEVVRHQLAYLESTGDLLPGELRPEDVIDSVLLRAYHEFVKEPLGRNMGDWLTELAKEHLRREVKRVKSERNRTVHIEEDIPETPPVEEVTTLGEEILDFYQPDEDLKLEDIFPEAGVSTPEDFVAAKEELLRCVNASLAGMPTEWRRALRLRHGGGFTAATRQDGLRSVPAHLLRIILRDSYVPPSRSFAVSRSSDAVKKRSTIGRPVCPQASTLAIHACMP